MEEEKNNLGRPVAVDGTAKSANKDLPAFLARPSDAPVYHGFQLLDDVVVDGFTLGLITDFEQGGTAGDAFVVAPDNSRAGLVWEVSDDQVIEELCPIENDRWGVWAVSFPREMSGREDARVNLRAILPRLKPKWEEWRERFGKRDNLHD
jgi:hypothetical protein